MDGVILNEVLSTYSRGLFSFLLVVILQAAGSLDCENKLRELAEKVSKF